MNDSGINVLMVGGRRAGKTSMLAGLFEVMLGDDIKKLVNVEDVTESENDSLAAKTKELRDELRNMVGKVIMDTKQHTDKFHPYKLKITLSDSGHSTQITFTDVNGEYYANVIKEYDKDAIEYKKNRQQLIDNVRKSDVILVAIDTPFLMEGSIAQNNRANCVNDINALLTELKKEDKAKLVVFVPIKCEKWAYNGHKLEEVTEKVVDVYSTTINQLQSPLVEILVIPVQTVGGMKFREFLPAYLYTAHGIPRHCSLIDNDSKLRFNDGSTKDFTNSDIPYVVEDSTSVFLGADIERPNAWFDVTSDHYTPKNCEQLAYHILRYMLNRAIDAEKASLKKKEEKKGLRPWVKWGLVIAALASGWGWLYAVAAASFVYDDKMGDVSFKEMEDLVNKLSFQGYIKDSVDGIKIVKPYQKLS